MPKSKTINLRMMLMESGYRQVDLAYMLGVHKQQVNKWVKDGRCSHAYHMLINALLSQPKK